MKEKKPIHYEPHPVSPERKAELIASGVQIIDAIYKPAEMIAGVIKERPDDSEAGEQQILDAQTLEPVAEAPKRRGRPPRI